MSPSQILSKISRLGLLSVFCAGLFLTSGELTINPNNGVYLGNGGVYSVAVAETVNTTTAAGVNAASKGKTKDPMDETINSIISFFNLGIGVLTFCITPLIMLAGWLLSPDWTFGEIFGLRPILHQLWILVSNVVYVIFGFMLVFVAFANIFGGESSKAYEMKTMLPKLVTGMLMVPFTWFIVSAVLSISNVLTASVIQLPVSTILKSGGETSTLLTDPIIPKEITFDKNNASKAETSSDGKNASNGAFTASDCAKNPKSCLSIKEFLTGGGGGAYNLLSVYAYGIFRIQGYKSITLEQKVNKVIDVAMKLGFGAIFFVIFGILVIAIVYALFSRAIMLWLYAMFSPFFALTYVLGDKGKKLEKFTIKEFISLAMVPVYVSAALAFGLMFLGLVMGATNKGTTGAQGELNSDYVNIKTKDTETTFKFGTNDTSITLKTIGLLDPEAKNGASKALDIGKGVIGTIIMNVLALAILWMAVMAALGSSKITEAAVKPIADFGSEIGKLAMKAPQYIPIPLPGKNADGTNKSVSMAGLQGISNTISGALSTAASNQGAEIGKTFAEALGIKQSELTEALRNATNSLGQHKGNKDLQVQDWSKAIGGMKSVENMKAHKDTIVPQLGSMLDKTDTISTADRDKLKGLAQKGEFADFIKEFNKIAKDSSGNTIASQSATPDDIIKAAAAKGGTTTSTATPATAIPATPPTAGTTNMPTINKTHITVNGTAPIATGGTSSARTITVAQFDAIKTASGMSDADLKTKLASEHISVIQ